MAGREGCESLFAQLKDNKIATEEFPVRHCLAIQRAAETQELGNVFWLPGLGNPADGLARTKSDMAPLLGLLEFGAYNRGTRRQLLGVAPCDN